MKITIKKVVTLDCDSATAVGNYGNATATGNYSSATVMGDRSSATVTGDCSRASASGYYSRATAINDYGSASASGGDGRATAIGDYSRASAIGCRGVAIAGYNGTAKADASGCIAVLYWDKESGRPRIAVGYVGEGGIKSNTWYCVKNGILKEDVE